MSKFSRITRLTGFPPEAQLARSIQSTLVDLDFGLDEPRRIAHAVQLRTKCGALINVYDTGNVVVQGHIIPAVAEESLYLLRQVLPTTTRWQCR